MKQNFSQILKLSKQLNGPVILFDSDDQPFACLPLEQLEALMGDSPKEHAEVQKEPEIQAQPKQEVAPEPPKAPISAPQRPQEPAPRSSSMDESRFYLEPID
jgi:hypothetical protein